MSKRQKCRRWQVGDRFLLGRYQVVLADPPWHYNDKAGAGQRGAEFKYSVLKPADIMSLPVRQMVADDAVLFLWITFPQLPLAEQVMRAWGFEYRTVGFVWVKQNPKAASLAWGMGNWTRSNAEACLLGIRGKPKRASAGVHSVVVSPRLAHSQKPAEVRERIVKLCGDVPRIELFARDRGSGWHVWGNEVESDIDMELEGTNAGQEEGRSGAARGRADLGLDLA